VRDPDSPIATALTGKIMLEGITDRGGSGCDADLAVDRSQVRLDGASAEVALTRLAHHAADPSGLQPGTQLPRRVEISVVQKWPRMIVASDLGLIGIDRWPGITVAVWPLVERPKAGTPSNGTGLRPCVGTTGFEPATP
jgi:hypothetical protein